MSEEENDVDGLKVLSEITNWTQLARVMGGYRVMSPDDILAAKPPKFCQNCGSALKWCSFEPTDGLGVYDDETGDRLEYEQWRCPNDVPNWNPRRFWEAFKWRPCLFTTLYRRRPQRMR